ncbi:MAG: neutral/alkaline non-lysosomal ceramidase N-terminal domain-containing protein, partial [Bryobacteraceae bacterium]
MTRRELLLATVPAAALRAQTGWQAGIARAVITPRESIWLAGYGDRNKPSEGIRQDLQAKALALRDGTGAVSVLVTADLLGFTGAMSEAVAERVRKQHGIPRARILLNASHTHSGPVTGQVHRGTYVYSAEQRDTIERYTAWLLARLADMIGLALADLGPATLDFGQGSAGFAVNRRRVVMGRNLPGPVEHDVPVLAVRAPGGALRAIVFGYACHATVLNDYQINADWPGYAQEALEAAHPGATALFVAGCGADANPLPRRSVELARTYGEILATAVGQTLAQKMAPVAGPLRAALSTADVPLAPPPSREEFQRRAAGADSAVRRHAQLMLERYDRLPSAYPYT